MSSESIAVLGTGTMGAPIARHLLEAGHEVRVFNRTPERAAPLAEQGARVCARVEDATDGAGVLVTMLSDADAVLGVLGRGSRLRGLAPGAVWLQLSTIGIAGTEACAALAGQLGIDLVDAPVLGTKAPAEAGELIVLASGPDTVRERCAPMLATFGKRTLWLGDAGAGSRLKLVANAWIVGLVEALAETIALAEGLDVDPRTFLDAIGGGPLDSGYAQLKGGTMLDGSYDPSFRLALAAKDADLVLAAMDRHELELPLLSTVAARLHAAVAAGHGDADLAATVETTRG